jgi:hypothetical protein
LGSKKHEIAQNIENKGFFYYDLENKGFSWRGRGSAVLRIAFRGACGKNCRGFILQAA